MNKIATNIQELKKEVPANTKVIAVSKHATEKEIKEAYNTGQRDFGENKVQDAKDKIENLKDLEEIKWHFVGHLQSNKTRKCVELFDYIHSIDTMKSLERVHNATLDLQKPLKVCMQIKLAEDENKHGMSPNDLLTNMRFIKEMQELNEFMQVIGLMTILPEGLSPEQEEELFSHLKILKDKASETLDMPELSMGMSQDYKLALKQGATMIRIGQAIFN